MKDFLKSAEDQLKSAEDRKAVMLELKEHLELKKEFFESIGYDTETSEEKANEAMGSGEIIGQRLSEIHRRKNKKIIGIFILCTVCVNAGALFTFPTDAYSYKQSTGYGCRNKTEKRLFFRSTDDCFRHGNANQHAETYISRIKYGTEQL